MATVFENLAPRITRDLMAGLNLTVAQAVGVVGNGMGESGLRAIQEVRPTSGRGGFGFWQWTGSRRVAFETWCRQNGLSPTSYEANVGYLIYELKTGRDGGDTLRHLRLCTTAKAAAETFEHYFERSRDGRRNWPVRVRWAEKALALYHGATLVPDPLPQTPIPLPPVEPVKPLQSTTIQGVLVSAIFKGIGLFVAARYPNLTGTWEHFALIALPFAVSFVGDAMAAFGRVTATQPIAGTKVAAAAQNLQDGLYAQVQPPAAGQPVGFMWGQLPDLETIFSQEPVAGEPASPQSYMSFGQILSVLSQAAPYLMAAIRFVNAHPEFRGVLTTLFDVFKQWQEQDKAARRPGGT